jgi:hypothetical protein
MAFVLIRQQSFWRLKLHDHKFLLNLDIFKLVRGENVSTDNVVRSLALRTSNRYAGMYKKLSSKTFVNLELLTFTHIEREIERVKCNFEFKIGLQM